MTRRKPWRACAGVRTTPAITSARSARAWRWASPSPLSSPVSIRVSHRPSIRKLFTLTSCTIGFREETREEIPGWDGLMFIYGIFFVPTFFSLLVGANLLVWARARINYVFIFGTCSYFLRVCLCVLNDPCRTRFTYKDGLPCIL